MKIDRINGQEGKPKKPLTQPPINLSNSVAEKPIRLEERAE